MKVTKVDQETIVLPETDTEREVFNFPGSIMNLPSLYKNSKLNLIN
jgi:hypothetical protein